MSGIIAYRPLISIPKIILFYPLKSGQDMIGLVFMVTVNPSEIRKKLGVTPEVLAVEAGCSISSIRDFEAGNIRKNPHARMVSGLARAYGISERDVREIFSPAPARRAGNPLRGKSL